MEVLNFQTAEKVLASLTSAPCSESTALNTLHYSKTKHSWKAQTQGPGRLEVLLVLQAEEALQSAMEEFRLQVCV